MNKTEDLMELVNECEQSSFKYDSRAESAMARAEELSTAGLVAIAGQIREKAATKVKLGRIAAAKYIEITPAKIQSFLNKKADGYNKEQHKTAPKNIAVNTHDSMYAQLANVPLGQSLSNMTISASTLWPESLTAQVGQFYNQELARRTGVFMQYQNQTTSEQFPWEAPTTEFLSAPTVHVRGDGPIGKFSWKENPIQEYMKLPPDHVVKKLMETMKLKLFDWFSIASVNEVHDPLLLGRINGHNGRFFLDQWGDDVCLDDVI